MKSLVLSLALLAAALLSGAAAQPADTLARRAALTEARYLKSIFKTDAAIERLSGLVTPRANLPLFIQAVRWPGAAAGSFIPGPAPGIKRFCRAWANP